jgi:haloacetate dehalogenase
MMDDFAAREIDTGETRIFVRSRGNGPPVLLLHGFPQTHLMWRGVAPLLANNFTVVCADLRGYGQSACPVFSADGAPYSKRAMAQDMVAVMERLGFRRFSVAGHDRGGHVASRLALDHPDKVDHLALLEVLPPEAVWERADARFAIDFWPWSVFAQPEPLAERILESAAEAVVDHALSQWGTPAAAFPRAVREAYVEPLKDPAHARAIAEDYRAGATVDREHDRADWDAGVRIVCPTLVLWAARRPFAHWYANEGGPIALWQGWSDEVKGHSIDAGHFFPEESPEETAEALNLFLQTRAVRSSPHD